MTKTFHTDNYGKIKVRNAMFDIDGTNLEEGIEIKGSEIDIIEIYSYFDIGKLNIKKIEKMIKMYQ